MSRKAKRNLRSVKKRNRNNTKLNGFETLESKKLLTAIHVDQADEHPDVGGCGDTTNECDTIMNAVHFANAGDDIVLKPDTYHENVVLTKSVDINSVRGRSTIRPAGGPVSISTGPGITVALRNLNLTGGMSGFDAKGTSYVQMFDVRANGNAMHGIAFDGGKLEIHQGEFSDNGHDGIVVTGGDLYMVDSVVSSNGGHGVVGMGVGAVELDNPEFKENAFAGALFDRADSLTATDIRATDNGAEGMIVDHATGEVSIVRSWFTDNGADGLIVAAANDKTTLTNVTATDNGLNGVHVVETAATTVVAGGVFGGNGGNGLNFLNVGNVDVRKDGGVKTDVGRNGGNGLAVTGANDVKLEGDFYFNTANGIDLGGIADATLSNINAHRNGKDGVLVSSAKSVSVDGGTFDLNGDNGIHVVDSTEDVAIAGVLIVENSENGISVESARDVSVTDATSKENIDHGIAINTARNVTVTGGSSTLNLKSGIAIGSPEVARLSGTVYLNGTQASDNGAEGVLAENVSDVTIRGGEFSKNTGPGIQINDGKKVSLTPHANKNLEANLNQGHGLFLNSGESFSLEGNNDTHATFDNNGGNGIALLDIARDVVIRAISPFEITASANGVNGIAVGTVRGEVEINNVTANLNSADGLRVVGGSENIAILNSTADRNGANGITVTEADKDVTIRDTSASLNSVDGIFVDEVSAKGLATDFKVTIDESSANANGASGIHIVNVERALIEDSFANDNITEGIQLAFISDDVTIKRSEANGNADGIFMSDVNDVNLQFTDAKNNAADGLRSQFGSTIHATGGDYSDNGASGWDVSDSGDVSTFGTTLSSNADDGLRISNPGAVNLNSSVITANGAYGFQIGGAAWATLSNLQHMGNVSDSVVVGTPTVTFTATTGELKTTDDVRILTVDVEGDGKDPFVISHVRTEIVEDNETKVVQDDIAVNGATMATIDGGDGADYLSAMDWEDAATTGLTKLVLNGGEGEDEIVVSFSKETELHVNGGDPDVAFGDRLTLEAEGVLFADDGATMSSAGMMDIHYQGIETVDAEQTDVQSPTVEIVDVNSSGPISEVTLRFSEPVIGLGTGDVRLTHNGSELDLSVATLETSDSGLTWKIGNLVDLTSKAGDYEMRLIATDSAIEDLFGNDLLSGDSVVWKNTPGDANGDGIFDSSDLIAAFVANKYGTEEMASHAEGDWNNDGVFNSSDLIYVFANGDYAG